MSTPPRRSYEGFVPGLFPIDAYGRGGFRFADMSHRGSILALPEGIHAWAINSPDAIDAESLGLILAAKRTIDVLLVGTGLVPVALGEPCRWALAEAGLRFDTMTTGGAVRTYNVMVAEGRRVAAALIAVP